MFETHRVACKIGVSRRRVAECSSLLYCYAFSAGSHLPTFPNVGRCEPVGTAQHRHLVSCTLLHALPPTLTLHLQSISLLITVRSHILFTQCNSHLTTWLILIELLFPNERHTCGWFRTNQPDNLLSITMSFRLGSLCSSLYEHGRPTARTHTHTHDKNTQIII